MALYLNLFWLIWPCFSPFLASGLILSLIGPVLCGLEEGGRVVGVCELFGLFWRGRVSSLILGQFGLVSGGFWPISWEFVPSLKGG